MATGGRRDADRPEVTTHDNPTAGDSQGAARSEPSRRDCPFCDDTMSILRSAAALAILNIAPVVPGHFLVVPARHVSSLTDLTSHEFTAFFAFAREVTSLVLQTMETDSFDWIVQEGQAAGQTIEHLHLHVVPRTVGDLEHPGAWFAAVTGDANIPDSEDRPRLEPDEHRAQAQRFREAIARLQRP